MSKPFSWSYSRLKNFETCAYRHEQVDIKKLFKDENEQMLHGNNVHKQLALACQGNPLPAEMEIYRKWVDRVMASPGTLLVEQQYAITDQFEPCPWFDGKAWFRGIGDAVRIWDNVGLVVDWKTGKVVEDSVQLMLMAQCLFSHYPQLQKVRSEFVWLGYDCTTPQTYTRQDLARQWPFLLERVAQMKKSWETKVYQKNPNRLCMRHCPVASCDYHGKPFR